MMKDADTAMKVSKVLHDTFNTLGDSIVMVNEHCGADEALLYRQKIGDIFGILVFGLMEPIYEEHPQLKPPNWDDPVPQPISQIATT